LSKAKQKGTSAETALVKYLQANGFPLAERRALTGQFDQGDVTGTSCLAWEVKNHKKYSISEWIKETEVERINAKADFGILVVKPVGVGISRPEDFWAIMPLAFIVDLLREAGYGDAK